MACNRTYVFLGINQINMYLILILLVIVLAILFVPVLGPTVKLLLLSILLVFVIAYSVIILIRSSQSSNSLHPSVPEIQPCSNHPSYCQECNANPCRCAEILPGQKECPKCRGQLCTGAIEGIQSCGGCGRGYRCPGCLLA
jgi:hypothetical protein